MIRHTFLCVSMCLFGTVLENLAVNRQVGSLRIGIGISFVRLGWYVVAYCMYPLMGSTKILHLRRVTGASVLIVVGIERHSDIWSLVLIFCTVFRSCEDNQRTKVVQVRRDKFELFCTC